MTSCLLTNIYLFSTRTFRKVVPNLRSCSRHVVRIWLYLMRFFFCVYEIWILLPGKAFLLLARKLYDTELCVPCWRCYWTVRPLGQQSATFFVPRTGWLRLAGIALRWWSRTPALGDSQQLHGVFSFLKCSWSQTQRSCEEFFCLLIELKSVWFIGSACIWIRRIFITLSDLHCCSMKICFHTHTPTHTSVY